MKCHLKTILLVSWMCYGNYIFMMSVYAVSISCGNFSTNIPNYKTEDGSEVFNIVIEHSVLDPYLDILPNVSYTVIIQSKLPALLMTGFHMEITGNESFADNQVTELYEDITILDDHTENVLSKDKSKHDIACTLHQENSVTWHSSTFQRCFNISAVIYTNDRVVYYVSTIVCRKQGNRSYHVVDMSGHIESPGFPKVYPDDYNNTYIMFSMKKSSIYLQFQSFALEPSYRGTCFDAVTVISDKTDILCGDIQEVDLANFYFHSQSGKLMVILSTDNKIGDRGFLALYYTMDPNECNRSTTLLSDNITSIGYPAVYLPRMHCTVSITLPLEYRIQMTIKYIDIEMKIDGECVQDYLQIVSGNSYNVLCGNMSDLNPNTQTLQSSSSSVDITFVSNYLHEGQGFVIEYNSHIPCSNKTFMNTTGQLCSDNYPNSYSNNQDCYYTIELSDTNDILELTFETFYTESAHNSFLRGKLCNLDYIEIYEGDKIERICGQWKGREGSLSYRSETGSLTMRFVTNNNVTKSGFHATWQTTSGNLSSTKCASSWIENDQYLFEIVRNHLTWEEGYNDCQQKGGFLASITDVRTQAMLEEDLRNSENCTLKLDAFWIGANDILTENYYLWANGRPWAFTYWFPGWLDNKFMNKQPSDDGWSREDCVEIRNTFFNSHKGISEVPHYFWNDRQCSIRNPYICQFSKNGENPSTDMPPVIQNYKYDLSTTYTEVQIRSPGFPLSYPMLSDINITITAPEGSNVAITFQYFNLEFSETCEYDNLTLSSTMEDGTAVCGDLNTKLKTINWISDLNIAVLRLRTDGSINKPGFSLMASIYRYTYCDRFNDEAVYIKSSGCILPYLEHRLTYQQADAMCRGQNTELLSNMSALELRLIQSFAGLNHNTTLNDSILIWSKSTYEKGLTCGAFVINPMSNDEQQERDIQWLSCEDRVGFVCKWSRPVKQFNVTEMDLASNTGEISMIKDENEQYQNDHIIKYKFSAPMFYRIVLEIFYVDIEDQKDCLYDALTIDGFDNNTVLCGDINTDLPLYYTSLSNYATVSFRSDESVLGTGFKFRWNFVDTVKCFDIKNNGNSGVIKSFNFLHAFTEPLHCCSEINTAIGSRVIVNVDYSIFRTSSSCVRIIYSSNKEFQQFCGNDTMNVPFISHTIISSNNTISLCLHTSHLFRNDGFRAEYIIESSKVPHSEKVLALEANATGQISSPHFPDNSPQNIMQTTHLVAPVGYLIELNVSYRVPFINGSCNTSFQVYDETLAVADKTSCILSASCAYGTDESVVIQSNLNKLKIILNVGELSNTMSTRFNATYSVKSDSAYLSKTEFYPKTPFNGCTNESCFNGGICQNVSKNESICSCPVHYTGMFCQVLWCDLPVCPHGVCILNRYDYTCKCDRDFWGRNCNMTSEDCATTVCSGNGLCITDIISNKTCSCNTEWTGQSCNINHSRHYVPQPSRTLMDEPIWIGMIVVLMLLFLFGILFLTRRRCSRHFKCCEDTNSILKKQADDAIPAHNNCIPSSQGTPTTGVSPNLKFKFDGDASNFLTVENYYIDEIHTPPVNVDNVDAAARLFEAYNNKSETQYLDKQSSILSYEMPTVSGIVDGKLQFLQTDIDAHLSDTDNLNHGIPFSRPELQKSFTSLPSMQKERATAFTKSKSVHADFNHRSHYYPNIVVVNDSSNEHLNNETSDHSPTPGKEQRRSMQRQQTLDESEAQRKREVFALKSKSTRSVRLELPYVDSKMSIRRAASTQEPYRRSPSLTCTSFESDPTCWPNNRRFNKISGVDSSEDDVSGRTIMRSFCSQPDKLQDITGECKCCANRLNARSLRHRKPKYFRISRKRTTQQRIRSLGSEQSSSFENNKTRNRNHASVPSLHDADYHKNSIPPTVTSNSIDCHKNNMPPRGSSTSIDCHKNNIPPRGSSNATDYHKNNIPPRGSSNSVTIQQRASEAERKVSLHIIEGSEMNRDDFRKIPVRKSRSNDLNLNKSSCGAIIPDTESPFRKRSHSFHSETSEPKRSQHPDDLLNEDQKSNSSFYHEHDKQDEIKETSKAIDVSVPNHVIVSPLSALSVTDTDTGFSSSSPWLENAGDNMLDQSKQIFIKDSAYQTKQSSVERNPLEGPNNSYENPEDGESEGRDMTRQLQQAAKRLAMYEKNHQYSKDSALTNTFSEADDTASCDSDNSSRETHTPVRPRSGNYNFLLPKLCPLEQVSEECDSNTQESIALNDEVRFIEDIEMKEFNA